MNILLLPVLGRLPSNCLIVQANVHRNLDRQSKYVALVISLKFVRENESVYYNKKKAAINMHNLAAPDVSGGPYYWR